MPKYQVNIEGTIYEWDKDTISVPELRSLAGLAADQDMIEIDLKDNSERSLGNDEVVDLKPGKGFAKKVVFKRG
jgi:Multiubiquitin